MIRRFLWLPCTAAAIVSLSACVTPPVQPPIDPAVRQAQLEALTQFSFSGGLGIWTDEQSLSARINWQQSDDTLQVQLSGPLGIGDLRLDDESGVATLSRAGRTLSEGPSVDRVLQTGLGLSAPVPLKQLQRWVKGVPGNAKTVETDAQGKLSSLHYTDELGTRWEARFLRYSDLGGLQVPSLITASGGAYSVRLVLKNWQRVLGAPVPERTQSNTRLAIPTR